MENPNTSTNAHQGQPLTQGFPAQTGYQQSGPVFGPPTPPPRRRRRGLLILVTVLASVLALVIGFVVGWGTGSSDGDVEGLAGLPVTPNDGGERQAAAAAPGGGGPFDLRRGSVFVQSNDPTNNEVVAFARADDGRLTEVGRYKTGGVGSGSFEDSAHGVVLGTPAGEASPQQNLDSAQLLFVSNAGSNSVSVFRVDADGLQLVNTVPSGGEKPVSLTVSHNVLYVLNSGELDDRFVLRFPDQFLDNCTHGGSPSVSGFRVDVAGKLTAIPNSTRPLSGGGRSGCAQASFTPDGSQLVVTERLASLPQQQPEHGAITIFAVNPDGTLGAKAVRDSAGEGPFGFAYNRDGTLLVTEQAHAEKGRGTASSYTMLGDRELKPISKAVPTNATDTCWIVPTKDGRLAFTSNALGGGSLSSYRIDDTGALNLLQGQATDKGPKDGTLDIALSRDSRWLYALNSHFGLLQVYQANSDGTLKFVEEHEVFKVTLPENGGQLDPFGIAAF